MNRRIHLIINGSVQGVGYRYETKFQARILGIHGWVKNRPDGTVEILAESSEDSLKELVRWCQRGPINATVEKVEIAWHSATNEFSSFDIK